MKILVAEKDSALRDILAARLQARGYEVLETESSVETIHVLGRDRVDLIMISSEMEPVKSMLLIEAIRKKAHLATVPVILLTEESKLAELVMSRYRGYDDFLTKPFNAFVLQLRVVINIEKSKQRAEANALTHLPGNHAIEKVIREKIEKNEKFSVLYIDINHFKSFNDYYSFEKGDDVIRQTAKILVQTAQKHCTDGNGFVGHIGGDDFIVVLDPYVEEAFAKEFIAAFDQISATYYNEADRKRGCIRVTNRRGKRESFPIMSCSVAACTNLYRPYKNLGEIARDAMEVKSFLKSQTGSCYLRDRRSEPIKGLEEALRILAVSEEKKEEEHVPLGQQLLREKLVSQEQLQEALKEHLKTGKKLGQILMAMKIVQGKDVGRILEKKFKVEYVSLHRAHPSAELIRLIPYDFMKLHRVIPINLRKDTLVLGMCNPLDQQVIDKVQCMTHLKVQVCLVLENELDEFLSRGPASEGMFFQEYAV